MNMYEVTYLRNGRKLRMVVHTRTIAEAAEDAAKTLGSEHRIVKIEETGRIQ